MHAVSVVPSAVATNNVSQSDCPGLLYLPAFPVRHIHYIKGRARPTVGGTMPLETVTLGGMRYGQRRGGSRNDVCAHVMGGINDG